MEVDTETNVDNELYPGIEGSLWHGVCRVCTKYNDYTIPIFQEMGTQYELPVKIAMHLSLEVSQNDGLPQSCCHACASLIVSWHDLVVLAEEALYKLNNMRLSYVSDICGKELSSSDVKEETNALATKQAVDEFSEVVINEKTLQCTKQEDVADENNQIPDNNKTDISQSVNNENLDIIEPDKNVLENADINIDIDDNDGDNDTVIYSEYEKPKKKRGTNTAGLQAYKLHQPMKYIDMNERQYLRTKVFGFEPDNAPDGCLNSTALYFTCCICRETMESEGVISHSKSHYPLKESDSCQICCFGFISIDCFRNHLKKHTVFIDEEYRPTEKNEDVGIINKNESFNGENSEISNEKSLSENEDDMDSEESMCEFCGMIYSSRNILRKHIRRVHVSPFLCKFCKKRFSNKTSLKHHRCILVVEKGPDDKVSWFNCKCKKIFLFEEQYTKHTETCEKSKYVTCQECGREFADKAKLEFHILQIHVKPKVEQERKKASVWICEICGSHLSKFSAKKHYMTHLFMEKKFTCDICEMRFIDKVALEKHAHTHTDVRPFSCEICKATFKRKDHVKMHIKNKHNVSDDSKKQFECQKCKRHFTTQSYLIRHQRLHSQGVSYECIVCKNRFPTEHSLKMHQTRTKHDNVKEEGTAMSLSTADWVNRYRCNLCNQRYGSITSLKKHTLIHLKNDCSTISQTEIKIENTDDQDELLEEGADQVKANDVEFIYQCPKCSKRYLSEFGLKLHLARTKHAPVQFKARKRSSAARCNDENSRFKCNVCNESFSALLNLKMHKIKCKHFSKCPYCEKRFALDFKLRNHLIKMHDRKDIDDTNEFTLAEIRPYECEVCHQKFAMNHNLVAHMQRKHFKEDDEETNPISVIYIDSEIFNQKTADGEEPVVYHCTDCWKNFFSEVDFQNHTHDDNETKNTSESNTVEEQQLQSTPPLPK